MKYPEPYSGERLQTDVSGVAASEAHIAHLTWTAAQAHAADTDAVHAAVTDTGVQHVITTALTSPPSPRNITATAGGTDTDVKAIQVIIEGTDYLGATITETLPAFTVNTLGSVVGSKAFKTVTKVTIPAHDGTGATTEIGYGDKLGLPYKLSQNTVIATYLNDVKEGVAPTVATSSSDISGNTLDLNSALDGHAVDVYLLVD